MVESQLQLGSSLSDKERQVIEKLIHSYEDVFASNPKKPRRLKSMQHEIETGEAKPVYVKPRRIPEAWKQEVNQQVKEMIENDIISPSSSPWNSPILLTRKKDGTMRFVCDFRKVNDATKKDTYPLPNIKDVIDKMSGTVYWTSLKGL